MRLKSGVLVIALLFVLHVGIAQQNYEDSVMTIIKATQVDSVKAKLYRDLGRQFFSTDQEKAIEYNTQALKFETDSHKKGLIHYSKGMLNWQLGHYNKAVDCFEQALPIFTELQDSIYIGRVYNNIAASNWGLKNGNESLKYYQIGLKIRRAINDKMGVSNILNNIGLIYQDWELYEDAIKWHRDALEVALEIDRKDPIAYSYSNIALCQEKLNQLDTALSFHFKALEIKEDLRTDSYFYANIGSVYFKMSKVDSALFYYHKSLVSAREINNENRIAIAQYNLGKSYIGLNQMELARSFIDASLKLARENEYGGLIKDNLYALAEIEETDGNKALAFKYFKDASVLKDSIFNKEKMAKFTDLQIKFNLEQQQKENLLLKKNNEIQEVIIRQHRMVNLIIVVGIVLTLIILFFIARSRMSLKKLSIKLEKSEKKLLLANADKDKFFTIIAHDLKSPFNSILGFAEVLKNDYENLDEKDKSRMINSISNSTNETYKLLENLLIWSQNETGRIDFKPRKKDLSKIVDDVLFLIRIQAEAKQIRIENTIKVKTFASVDKDMINAIFRNLISNAIKFTEKGGQVFIDAENALINGVKFIKISVEDNGVGMTEAEMSKLFNLSENHTSPGTNSEKGTGLGLILCQEFVSKHGGAIWVESKPGVGSVFKFTLSLV